MMKNYTQNEEQAAILDALKDLNPTASTLLDLGAADGVTFSNSRALMELGWRGVFVEANPIMFTKLLKLYVAEPNATLILGALYTSRRLTPFHLTDDLVSTLDPQLKTKWTKNTFREVYIPTITMAEIATLMPKPPEFVTVDVEGLDLQLLHQMVSQGWLGKVKCVCVEYGVHDAAMLALFKSHGYAVTYQSGENFVFVRP